MIGPIPSKYLFSRKYYVFDISETIPLNLVKTEADELPMESEIPPEYLVYFRVSSLWDALSPLSSFVLYHEDTEFTGADALSTPRNETHVPMKFIWRK